MHATTLRAFFHDQVSAKQLDDDLRDAFERTSADSFSLRMTDLQEDCQVRTEHLVKLCDAVLTGELEPEALRAVGFGMIASNYFQWDGDEPDGDGVAETIHDWASPEANYQLSRATVAKFRHRLLTGENTFTKADLFTGKKGRNDEWTPL